jgi:SAM-dependent methyltransferase
MHPTAYSNCQLFFDAYGPALAKIGTARVVDIGAQDVNGSLKTVVPSSFQYVGVDFVAGKGVDIVIEDPYELPIETGSVDAVLSSSCFEHSEMFWLSFLEIMRILKPHGLFYLNAPSNGSFHRYPVDCWRFYPDAGRALVTWARRNAINAELIESYLSEQQGGPWNDFVSVFIKDRQFLGDYCSRITDYKRDFTNGILSGRDSFINYCRSPEDVRKLGSLTRDYNR